MEKGTDSRLQELKKLKEQVEICECADRRLTLLHGQRRELEARLGQLESHKAKEKADVEKLEGRSLARLFYQVLGRMDEKLDEERREAYEAAVRCDAVKRELEAVEYDIKKEAATASRLSEYQRQYEKCLKERREEIRRLGSSAAESIQELELEIISLRQQVKELGEAIGAGSLAQDLADSVLESLDKARDWGTWDLAGGGTFVTAIKHQRLDEAQEKVESLQVQLSRFQTELADVGRFQEGYQVNMDGFLRFADWFFDGLFVDLTVLNRIKESQNQVSATRDRVRTTVERLREMKTAAEEKIQSKQDEIEKILLTEME